MSQRQAVLQPLNGSNRVAKTVRASAYGKLVQARLNNRLEVDRALEANTTTTTEVNTTTAFRPSGIAPVWAKVCVVFIHNRKLH